MYMSNFTTSIPNPLTHTTQTQPILAPSPNFPRRKSQFSIPNSINTSWHGFFPCITSFLKASVFAFQSPYITTIETHYRKHNEIPRTISTMKPTGRILFSYRNSTHRVWIPTPNPPPTLFRILASPCCFDLNWTLESEGFHKIPRFLQFTALISCTGIIQIPKQL